MQMVGQGPYRGYPPAPQYAPQPSPTQSQSNVDWVQEAWYEAACNAGNTYQIYNLRLCHNFLFPEFF